MHPLDGPRAKISRARLHLEQFGISVRAYLDRAPFRLVAERDLAAGEIVFRAAENPDFPPVVPIDVVLVAGEVAHNLRSALDHLVWQLVAANTGLEPTGTRSGFPIFRTEEGYNRRAAEMIAGVSADAEMRIRAAQPFHAGANAEQVLTWVVQEMNNTDKHRIIPLATTYTFVGHVRMHTTDGRRLDILPPQDEMREPLQDGMEVARVPIGGDLDGARVDIPLGCDVAFVQVGGLRNHPATDLLTKSIEYVDGLVESFRGQFR